MPAPVARTVYATTGLSVNGEQFFADSSSFSGAVPLAALPLERETLAALLSGFLVRELKWTWKRVEVFVSLVYHANKGHDLVWPGIDCLAAEAGVSSRTVKRANADLLAHGYLCVLDGVEIPREHPSQLHYEGERRSKKKLPTNNYLLSPLARLLPYSLIERVRALLDLARRRGAKSTPDSQTSDPEPDPFADSVSESTSMALSASVCNVAINSVVDAAEGQTDRPAAKSGTDSGMPAGPPLGAPSPAPAQGSGVLGAKLGLHKIEAARVGLDALKGIGVKVWMARKIVANPPAQYRERGQVFGVLLARYARRRSMRNEISTTMAAYAVATWREWPQGDGWPDWFDDTVAEVERIFSTNQENIPKNIPSAAGRSVPPGDEPTREELLAALASCREAFPEERLTVHSAVVRSHARSLMRQRERSDDGGG